jgi:phage terminase Nu1 subunit (DNA packaging protein)
MDLRKLRQVDLATLLKVTPRQIHNLVKQGMPSFVDDDGKRKYDGPECVAWFVTRERGGDEDLGDVDAAKVRIDTVRADILEVELAEKLGKVMTVEQFQLARNDADARVAAKLKALENRLAPAVVGTADVQDGLKRVKPLVAEAMEELYRGEDIPQPAEDEDEEDVA